MDQYVSLIIRAHGHRPRRFLHDEGSSFPRLTAGYKVTLNKVSSSTDLLMHTAGCTDAEGRLWEDYKTKYSRLPILM